MPRRAPIRLAITTADDGTYTGPPSIALALVGGMSFPFAYLCDGIPSGNGAAAFGLMVKRSTADADVDALLTKRWTIDPADQGGATGTATLRGTLTGAETQALLAAVGTAGTPALEFVVVLADRSNYVAGLGTAALTRPVAADPTLLDPLTPASVTASVSAAAGGTGQTLDVTFTVLNSDGMAVPTGTTGAGLTYQSSEPSRATVASLTDRSCRITYGATTGAVTVTATTPNGKSGVVSLTVRSAFDQQTADYNAIAGAAYVARWREQDQVLQTVNGKTYLTSWPDATATAAYAIQGLPNAPDVALSANSGGGQHLQFSCAPAVGGISEVVTATVNAGVTTYTVSSSVRGTLNAAVPLGTAYTDSYLTLTLTNALNGAQGDAWTATLTAVPNGPTVSGGKITRFDRLKLPTGSGLGSLPAGGRIWGFIGDGSISSAVGMIQRGGPILAQGAAVPDDMLILSNTPFGDAAGGQTSATLRARVAPAAAASGQLQCYSTAGLDGTKTMVGQMAIGPNRTRLHIALGRANHRVTRTDAVGSESASLQAHLPTTGDTDLYFVTSDANSTPGATFGGVRLRELYVVDGVKTSAHTKSINDYVHNVYAATAHEETRVLCVARGNSIVRAYDASYFRGQLTAHPTYGSALWQDGRDGIQTADLAASMALCEGTADWSAFPVAPYLAVWEAVNEAPTGDASAEWATLASWYDQLRALGNVHVVATTPPTRLAKDIETNTDAGAGTYNLPSDVYYQLLLQYRAHAAAHADEILYLHRATVCDASHQSRNDDAALSAPYWWFGVHPSIAGYPTGTNGWGPATNPTGSQLVIDVHAAAFNAYVAAH